MPQILLAALVEPYAKLESGPGHRPADGDHDNRGHDHQHDGRATHAANRSAHTPIGQGKVQRRQDVPQTASSTRIVPTGMITKADSKAPDTAR